MWELPGGSGYRGQAGAVTETRGCCYGIPARSRYGFPIRSTYSRCGNHSARLKHLGSCRALGIEAMDWTLAMTRPEHHDRNPTTLTETRPIH